MKEISEKLKQALDRICKDGLNIYMLINKLKKQIKEDREYMFPESVLLKVCQSYWKYKPKQPWPWFLKVIKKEAEMYYAQKHIEQNKGYKKLKMPPVMKQILANLGA